MSITQAAAECRFELNGLPQSISSTGVQTELSLVTHQACSWTARVTEAWGDVTPNAGKGPAVLRLSVAPNTGGAERSISLTIGNERVTAVQEPLPSIPTPVPPTPVPPRRYRRRRYRLRQCRRRRCRRRRCRRHRCRRRRCRRRPYRRRPCRRRRCRRRRCLRRPCRRRRPPPTPPTPVREITIDGEVGDVSGSCPALTFTLDGRTVVTSNQTEFSRGPCKDLRSGVEVEVRGTLMSDGRVQAIRVRYEKD